MTQTMTVFVTALLSVFTASVVCGFKPFDCSDIYDSGRTASGIYSIYPAGEVPVWVYCEMISNGKYEDNGGWTVIQRRMDGSINFYQPWGKYKRGFGATESEYWLGLENMYELTRNRKYILRVDLEDFEGKKGFALYSSFSVGPEADRYKLHVSGFKDGGAGDSLSDHNDQKFSTFDEDHDAYGSEVRNEIKQISAVIICGQTEKMTMMVFLVFVLLVLLVNGCSQDENMPVDCSDVYKSGQTVSGIYSIYPAGNTPVWVYCEMVSDGKDEDKGQWTVIQRRMDGSVNFYRPWNQYKRGFGNVEGEHWLGLENMYQLTRKNKYMLRVDLEDFEGRKEIEKMAMMAFLMALLSAFLMSGCGQTVDSSVDCSDIYNSGQTVSGIYSIYPGDVPVSVYCQMISVGNDEDNGGWTVIQRRMDGSVNFYQPWNQYKRGFGNVEGEYWLGLENMYQLTSNREYMLRVDLEDFDGNKAFALYSSFSMMVFLAALLPVVLMNECNQDENDCSSIYNSGETLSGIYSIYPAGEVPVLVYCEMISVGNDEDKGGWTIKQISAVIYRGETEKMALMVFLVALLPVVLMNECNQDENDCSSIYDSGETVSEIYSIYPAGDDPVLVYCEMISDGNDEDNGGWTLKASLSRFLFQSQSVYRLCWFPSSPQLFHGLFHSAQWICLGPFRSLASSWQVDPLAPPRVSKPWPSNPSAPPWLHTPSAPREVSPWTYWVQLWSVIVLPLPRSSTPPSSLPLLGSFFHIFHLSPVSL
ncbi:hypothetical protein QQF64_000384 [Cirrhinus molitorella]|uniref:Fibrinogen C-terminal domain-containing protein n=1 Tax=Cirrhinus molitorella TaxID=172907 RepID=A0ABR3NXS1_9TELE